MKASSLRFDILPDYYRKLEEKTISDCISCRICVDKCPVIPLSKLRDMRPQEIMREVKTGLEKGQLSDIIVERAFACSRCGICIDICPKDINVYELQHALRCQVQTERQYLPPEKVRMGDRLWDPYDFDDVLVGIQIKPDERRWIDSIPEPESIQKKDVVLYVGCHCRRDVDKVNIVMDILEMLGYDFVTIAGDAQLCCGTRPQIVGDLKEADRVGLQLISVLEQYEPKEVLVICATCLYRMSTNLSRLRDIPFRMTHVYETIAKNLNKLHFTRSIQKKVTLHDPCKMGRMLTNYESARMIIKAIPGLELVEMAQNRENALCCGGTAYRYNPTYARALRKRAMDCAAETGADVLATACFFCHLHFSAGANEYPYEVLDVIQLLGEGLGMEYEDKLSKYRSYHDPERVIRETRDYIDASPYTVEEMKQVLPRLIP